MRSLSIDAAALAAAALATSCSTGDPVGATTTATSSATSGQEHHGESTSGASSARSTARSTTGSSSATTAVSTATSSSSTPPALVFSPYKDTSIGMDWNTNAIQSAVGGVAAPIGADLVASGGRTVTLAFATGECGDESWGGVAGATLAKANVSALVASGARYIVSTGGANGPFTCGSDAGFAAFVSRWQSAGLVGVDFDIEAGQTPAVIRDLVLRIQTAHGSFPTLRFSVTLATLANNDGGAAAKSLGPGVADSLNAYGDEALQAIGQTFGPGWPSYLTVNLMVMDYGTASSGVCVVRGAACDMGQSALQAVYNLHDQHAVPYENIEVTPMIGQNDAAGEQTTLADVDTIASFALAEKLGGAHFWSYDRDVDCAAGAASATCNSMGAGYAGPHGYLKRFLEDGLH